MKEMNVLSLFDGMSCGQIALNKVGVNYDNYYACEIDKYAMQITNKNYPNTIQLGDITKLDVNILPKIELLFGGSPCQSFSNAGNGKGFNGKSGLFWEYVRVLKEVKPTYFLLENVVMKKEWKDIITNELGVEAIMINSSLVSAQNRKRLYWTNIPNITQPDDLGLYLKDIMEESVDNKYNFTQNFYKKKQGTLSYKKSRISMKTPEQKANTLLTKPTCIGGNGLPIKISDDYIRVLTPIECERLQTIPDNYTEGVSNSQRYKMIGNGWTVDVIAHIFKNLKLFN
jgi:DNA (cytosine-5)-methyltransferase 3A